MCRSVVLFCFSCFFSAIVYAQNFHSAHINETLSMFLMREPDVSGVASIPELTRRVTAGFGAPYEPSKDAAVNGKLVSSVFCGASAAINTLTCIDVKLGSVVLEVPVPGAVSTVPVYYDSSWIIGTSKGILFRTSRSTNVQKTPFFTNNSLFALWGPESRKFIKSIRDNAGDVNSLKNSSVKNTIDWQWYVVTGSEFVGTPLINSGMVFALTANQFLYAVDLNTGRVKWTLRISPETSLRIGHASLTLGADKKEIVVGTTDGDIMGIAPSTGTINWNYKAPFTLGERFRAILAKPLFFNKAVIFSTSDALMQKVSLEKCIDKMSRDEKCSDNMQSVDWSYAAGSTATPVIIGNQLYVGSTNGMLISMDTLSANVKWITSVITDSAIVAITSVSLVNKHFLLVASAEGVLVLVDANNGKILDKTTAIGEPIGDFLSSSLATSEVCLSFATPGLRCFNIVVQ